MGRTCITRAGCLWLIIAGLGVGGCQSQTPPVQAMRGEEVQQQYTATATATPTVIPTSIPSATATAIPTATPIADASGYDADALGMIALINQWRIEEGLAPFSLHETLFEVAADQADYVLSLPSIPDGADIHAGPNGESSPERGLMAGWPHYATELQTAIGEVACARPDAAGCIGFWHESDIHRRTLTNPGYREIGAAVRPTSYGTLYIVVVGSRPNILPALVDPVAQRLYLTSEQFAFAGGGDWIGGVTSYQILPDAAAEPSEDAWQPYAVSAPLPEDIAGTFAVAYTDGTHQVIVEVQPTANVVWTPELIAALESQPTVAEAPPAVITPTPPATGTDVAAAVPTSPPAATIAPTVVPTVVPTTVAATGTGGELLILYDERSVTLVNASAEAIDLTGIVLAGSGTPLPVSNWQAYMQSLPVADFPSGECLQAWSWDDYDPGAPSGCAIRRAAVYVAPGDRFWGAADFEVRRGDTVLATCAVGAGRCEVDLP